MSQPENAWAIAEELMSQNMLDVPIHIAAPVIAKVLASRAPATSEYERGRQDFAEQAAHMIDINRRPWDERTSTEIAEAIRNLAATSGTPAEHNPARAPHNKFASLWCDACPRPTSGTPAPRTEIFSKANRLAKATNQVVGEKHDLYVTLEQLMEIL